MKTKHVKFTGLGLIAFTFAIYDSFAKITFGKNSPLTQEAMN